jgi:acylphosphatase
MAKQYRIRVYGRVQGVGFRYSARNEARRLGLKGWVANCPDGTVLTVVQGREADCNAYIRWCREGPGYSWVEKLDILEEEAIPLDAFQVRH